MPEKKQQNETILEQEKRKLVTINELAPVKANVSLVYFLFVLKIFSNEMRLSPDLYLKITFHMKIPRIRATAMFFIANFPLFQI